MHLPSWREIIQAYGERSHMHHIVWGHCHSTHCCPDGSQAPNAASQFLSKHPSAVLHPPLNTSAGRGGTPGLLTAQLLALRKPGCRRVGGTALHYKSTHLYLFDLFTNQHWHSLLYRMAHTPPSGQQLSPGREYLGKH